MLYPHHSSCDVSKTACAIQDTGCNQPVLIQDTACAVSNHIWSCLEIISTSGLFSPLSHVNISLCLMLRHSLLYEATWICANWCKSAKPWHLIPEKGGCDMAWAATTNPILPGLDLTSCQSYPEKLFPISTLPFYHSLLHLPHGLMQHLLVPADAGIRAGTSRLACYWLSCRCKYCKFYRMFTLRHFQIALTCKHTHNFMYSRFNCIRNIEPAELFWSK